MNVIAIDPGMTTGIAIRLDNGNWHTCVTTNVEDLYHMILSGNFGHIVFENFQAETISKYGLGTVEIIGGIKCLAIILKIPITKHMNLDRYPFMDDAKKLLKERGLRTNKDHELDALAHLLRWEYDNNNAK